MLTWCLVALAWGAVLLGLLGPHLGGEGPGLPGHVGFAVEVLAAAWVPGGWLLALAAILALLCRRPRAAAALAPLVLVVLGPMLWARAFARPAPDNGRPVLRVATCNLDRHVRDERAMVEALRGLDACVLVLPEYTYDWAARLEPEFAGDYPHRWVGAAVLPPGVADDGSCRLAVWSRLPAAGPCEVVDLGGYMSQLRVPLRWRERDFALYGLHPRKPWPRSMYGSAWRDRRDILGWLRREALPVVLAGDLNAPPRSAFVARLRALGLRVAAEEALGGAPGTWPVGAGAFAWTPVAIDHVLHGEAFATAGFRVGAETGSDHLPVVAGLVWRDG